MSRLYNFKKGDIVYWCHREGHHYSVCYGMVEEQYSDVVIVNLLRPKEYRLVNGIPIDQFPNETKRKKLPKGWSYSTKLFEITYEPSKAHSLDPTDPEQVKKAYEDGLLVKYSTLFRGVIEADITKEGYSIVKKYPMWQKREVTDVSIRPERLHLNYEDVFDEMMRERNELLRQGSLSDYEWSVEQIDKTLNRWMEYSGEIERVKNEYREWLLSLDKVEEIETRLFDGHVEWKYENRKKWNHIEI